MCPHCRQPLIIVELHGVELDYCVDCRGTWLDAGELELIVELAGGTPGPLHEALQQASTGRRGQRRCPRCRRKMRCVTAGQTPAVEVDLCPAGHGVWLDAGELATLVKEYADRDDAPVAQFLGDLFSHAGQTKTEEA